MRPAIDPRDGDIEDDASSSKRHSLLSLAGSLLAEISLPKLVVAFTLLVVVPGLALGIAPIAAAIWFGKLSSKLASALAGVWPALLLVIVVAVGWFGGRQLLRLAENSFWSLNSLIVQPAYTVCREGVRQLAERLLPAQASKTRRSRLRAAAALVSGAMICGVALLVLVLVLPHADLLRGAAGVGSLKHLAAVALANTVALVAGYLAAAAMVWAIADAAMAQPRDLEQFDQPREDLRTWRIAHLSDVHVVGERYGFRLESGRSGPRGNDRLARLLAQLDLVHASDPLDAIVVSGDMTDAGRSSEWAEFLGAVLRHPRLIERMLIIPGNHDLNIVDRANPARLDLPTSPNKRLRKLRVLSAMGVVQGERVRIVDRAARRLGTTLASALQPHLEEIARFADVGRPWLSRRLSQLWTDAFPLVLPPDAEDGLGIVLLDSNADTHFSFTNALGMVSVDQARGLELACAQYPRACWIIVLHHHVVEYPRPARALSERVGTALINGNWFVRRLKPLAGRAVLMHGHRHIDWIGECGGIPILSAPSPVMEATDDVPTYFYIHKVAIGSDRRLRLLPPQRITIEGEPSLH
ncbi:MAG TPA: metallophosphoesterase [Xanthobacteraceae bacterium]|nr:metallophosphoesterase [Xanthobacteraceae bacterium]